jgi:hypothetical protein
VPAATHSIGNTFREPTMPEAFALPFQLVDHMTKPGLNCAAGVVPLNQYLSSTLSNGGNDSAHSLLKNLRWLKDKKVGPSLNSIVGSKRLDLLLKGQGRPEDFVKVWDFLCRNKDQLDTYKVDVCDRRDRSDSDTRKVRKTGTLWDMYFKGKSDTAAIKAMVADRFFGIDCIGFMADYMIYAGIWPEYKAYSIPQWADKVFKTNVTRASDVKKLNVLIFDGHIAIVDWVWGMVDANTVMVDVCQSSSSSGGVVGAQCNGYAILKETSATWGTRRVFRLAGGTPVVPVAGNCVVMAMDGLFY